ncbi:general L-amino acid transport system substrate-binding protein [Loktanella ponticola]|uniref:General L-amino acid transport system substrate-binding protein n=1 Tax=Yoonia ponticola TaxID=1524255 RepID=A0A7W9EZA9_9RHOB|nr:transporter substrate-binding domain-containing protein [Yoonia ponticola]MBB5723683.1 general L-amino acid transport system substrate-binding protein [Yoonia ponticola]
MKLSKTARMTSLALCTAVLSSLATQGHADENSTTLSTVLDRGYLICGVGVADIGFAAQQVNGNWAGFDVDFCRAVAAATLGDAQAVEFVPLDSLNRLRALKDGDVDVLFRTTTYTMDRDVALGFEFPAITYYDSQRVLAHASTNAKRLADLDGFTICANAGTTSIANIRKAIEANDVDVDILEISSQAGRWRAFFGQECDAVTSDYSDLSAMVAAQGLDERTFVILDDEIANEPLSSVVLEGDQQWEQIIRWVVNLLVLSEAEGVGKDSGATVISQLSIPAPTALGLSDGWASQIISQVGNYGDIFARNLGDDSALGIKRGLNNLWRDGGLMYPLPMSTD